MAVHLSIGRIPSVFLLALLALAIAAGTAHYLSRSGLEPEAAPASQIAAPEPVAAELAAIQPQVLAEPPATLAPAPAGAGSVPDRGGPETPVDARPAPRRADAAVPLRPDPAPKTDTVRRTLPTAAATASLPAASPAADVREGETGRAVVSGAPQERVAVARLVVAPQGSPAPRDLAVSAPRPRNMAPMPTRAPRAARAGAIAVLRAATLFQSGAEIRIRKDANLYITARNIPENDRLLAAYNADRPNGGRVQTRFGEATAVPGLLGIATQAHRAQDPSGRNAQAYSLADAMRDAIWRRNTAARLKSLTTAQNACAEGAARRTPSIGLIAGC